MELVITYEPNLQQMNSSSRLALPIFGILVGNDLWNEHVNPNQFWTGANIGTLYIKNIKYKKIEYKHCA